MSFTKSAGASERERKRDHPGLEITELRIPLRDSASLSLPTSVLRLYALSLSFGLAFERVAHFHE